MLSQLLTNRINGVQRTLKKEKANNFEYNCQWAEITLLPELDKQTNTKIYYDIILRIHRLILCIFYFINYYSHESMCNWHYG